MIFKSGAICNECVKWEEGCAQTFRVGVFINMQIILLWVNCAENLMEDVNVNAYQQVDIIISIIMTSNFMVELSVGTSKLQTAHEMYYFKLT